MFKMTATLLLVLGTMMSARASTSECTTQLSTGENLKIIFVNQRVCPRCMDGYSSSAKITIGENSQSYYLAQRGFSNGPIQVKSIYQKFTGQSDQNFPETFNVISGSHLKIEYQEEVTELICQ